VGLAKCAIIGIGATEQGRHPDGHASELAAEAAARAIEDAGIAKSEIDGLVTCQAPFSTRRAGTDEDMGMRLGLTPAFGSTLEYGACAFSLTSPGWPLPPGSATPCCWLTGRPV